ncbi:hypothetical protein HDV01_006250 [Terramyces sp. JEL0728]|nr:hypothetical protein HDV01_006250 [Terramyces sp. JEL0728]
MIRPILKYSAGMQIPRNTTLKYSTEIQINTKNPNKLNLIEQSLRNNQPVLYDLLDVRKDELDKILKLHLKYQDLSNAIQLTKRFEINELVYNLLFHIWISTDCFPRTSILLDKFKQQEFKPSETFLLNLIKSLIRQRRFTEIKKVQEQLNEFKRFPFLEKKIRIQDYQNETNQFKLMLCDYMKSVQVCEYFYFDSFEMNSSLIASLVYGKKFINEFTTIIQKSGSFTDRHSNTKKLMENKPERKDYEKILKQLLNQKIPISCYSRLINAFLSINEYQSALLIYKKSLQYHQPNPYLIHPFEVFFIKGNELQQGIQFYNNYIQNGGYNSSQLLSAIMKLALDSNELVYFYNQSKRYNSNHYNLIFTHLLLRKEFKQLRITRDLSRYNYILFAEILKQQRRTRKIVKLFQLMINNGIKHSPKSLLLLLESLNSRKEISKIEYFIKQNKELTRFIYQQIILIYAKSRVFDKAAYLLNKQNDFETYLRIKGMCRTFGDMVDSPDPSLDSWPKHQAGSILIKFGFCFVNVKKLNTNLMDPESDEPIRQRKRSVNKETETQDGKKTNETETHVPVEEVAEKAAENSTAQELQPNTQTEQIDQEKTEQDTVETEEERKQRIDFSNAFHYLISHPDQKILDSIMEFEEKYQVEQEKSYELYRETIGEVQQPIAEGNIVEIAQERKRQQQEIQLYLDGYINQLNVNLGRQRKLYRNFILKTFSEIMNMEYTEEIVEDLPNPAPKPIEKQVPKPVLELMDMGFEEQDVTSALEMAKNSMEGAVMLLLESPDKVKEHARAKLLTKRFPKTMQQNSILRKSSSNSNIADDKKSLSEKRSFSLSKLVGNESPKPSRASPFSNFLEKMTDAFKVEDEARASETKIDFTNLSESFTIYSGTQQIRNLYSIQLKVVERGAFFKLNNELYSALKLSTYSALYSPSISAIILLVNENELEGYGRGKANKQLFDYCMLHPELHFDSEYFITKHSNIPNIHVVFHLVYSSLDEANSRTPLIQGYRSILELCHYTNINSIIIPMVPMPVPEKIRLDTTVKRSEVVFKQAKGLFNELSRNEKVGRRNRTVVFSVPQSSLAGEAFSGIREKLVSTFRTG